MRSFRRWIFLATIYPMITTSATSTADLCACGYAADGTVYSELLETDFTTVRNLLGPSSGWQLQEYILPANNDRDQPYSRSTSRDNVIYTKDGVQLIVKPPKDNMISGAELVTARNDFHYGSFRVGMKTSSVNGTCAAFFWYHNDAREIDVEILSREATSTSGKANLVIHSDDSEANYFDASKTPTFSKHSLSFSPVTNFHEYRIDWSKDRIAFFADGVIVKNMTENIPTESGRLFLNHWSNGSPGWSGGPPESNAIMEILYVKAYFNSSDTTRTSAAQKRCKTNGKGQTCAIPELLSTPGGNLPVSGSLTPPPSGSNNANHPESSTLPAPGQVPFLSEVPGNIVGQITYNVTYNCNGCPKKPASKNAASNLLGCATGPPAVMLYLLLLARSYFAQF